MKEDLTRFNEAEAARGPVIGTHVSPSELDAAPGVLIPCPGDEPDVNCESAELLEDEPGWVAEMLSIVTIEHRSSAQENNLGCARAWLDDWTGAREHFTRAIETGKEKDDVDRAMKNLRLARSAPW